MMHFKKLLWGTALVVVRAAGAAAQPEQPLRDPTDADAKTLEWLAAHGSAITAIDAIATGSVQFRMATLSTRGGGVAQLFDVRAVVADPRGTWLGTPRDFHYIGTNTDAKGVQV